MLLCWLASSLLSGAEVQRSSGDRLAGPSSVHSEYEQARFLAGAIYGQAAASNTLLFRFEREARRTGEMLDVRRDYICPDGKLAARERAVYEGNEPVFYEMHDLRTGERGTAKILHDPGNRAKGSIEFEYLKERGGGAKRRTEDLKEDTLVGDMLGPFLKSHWGALTRGEKVKCRCIVVSRRETVGFSFVKDSESLWQNQSVVIVKMEATSLFVAALVNPLFLTIEKAPPYHVLQYVGRTTPKIQSEGKWKNVDAVTVYDWVSAR